MCLMNLRMWLPLYWIAISTLGKCSSMQAPTFYAPTTTDARRPFRIACHYRTPNDPQPTDRREEDPITTEHQGTVSSALEDEHALKDGHEAIQSLKIYAGAAEIFRYTPSVTPSTSQFSGAHGVRVEWSRCDGEIYGCELQVRAPPAVLGLRCELSAEGPTFDIVSSISTVSVVAEPVYGPTVVGAPHSVSAGDVLHLNCSTDLAAPPADIEWLMDGQLVKQDCMSALGVGPADELGLRKSWRGVRLTVPPGDEDLRVVCEAVQQLPVKPRRAELRITRGPLEPQLSKYTAASGAAFNFGLKSTLLVLMMPFVLLNTG